MTETNPLASFLSELADLDVGALLALAADHRAVGEAALERARASARDAARRSGRAAELGELQDAIIRWAEAPGAGSGAWAGDAASEPLVVVDARRQAVHAVVDAATELLLGESLGQADRVALGSAWKRIVRARHSTGRRYAAGMRR